MSAMDGLGLVMAACLLLIVGSVIEAWRDRGRRPPTTAPCPYRGHFETDLEDVHG